MKTFAIACTALLAFQTSAQVSANRLVLTAETASVTYVFAQACQNSATMLKQMEGNVRKIINDHHPGEGEAYIMYYNASIIEARKKVEANPPTAMQCLGDIGKDFASMTIDSSSVSKLIDQKYYKRVADWAPTKGENVCREVFGTLKTSERTTKVAYRIRGFVEDVYNEKIRVLVSSIVTPDPYPAKNIVNWISLSELEPVYNKGAPVSENKHLWYSCENL